MMGSAQGSCELRSMRYYLDHTTARSEESRTCGGLGGGAHMKGQPFSGVQPFTSAFCLMKFLTPFLVRMRSG